MKNMKGQNRKVYPDIINHCYQRTINGKLLFYNAYDCLMFFSVFLMQDHIHNSSSAANRKALYRFTQTYTSVFAREHNVTCHEKGSVFSSPFGSVPKFGDKKARSSFIYIDNNPVERKLVEKAEDYQWNFLAYCKSGFPFSSPIVTKKRSRAMKRAMRIVTSRNSEGKYLPYTLLKRLFDPLTKSEKKQLADYIVNTYNVLDYEAAIRFFGSYEQMIEATHSVTGSEYDLNEVFVGKSDKHYAKMTSIIMRTGRFNDIHDIFRLSPDEKMVIFDLLQRETDATLEQIAKYLHIPFKKA